MTELIIKAVEAIYVTIPNTDKNFYKPLRTTDEYSLDVRTDTGSYCNTVPAILAVGLMTLFGIPQEEIEVMLDLGMESNGKEEYKNKLAAFNDIVESSLSLQSRVRLKFTEENAGLRQFAVKLNLALRYIKNKTPAEFMPLSQFKW